MLLDTRLRRNPTEKRPVFTTVTADTGTLTVLTTGTSPAAEANPAYRLLKDGEVVTSGPVTGYTSGAATAVSVWHLLDAGELEPDTSYTVELTFEARATGESENRRYSRAIGVYVSG